MSRLLFVLSFLLCFASFSETLKEYQNDLAKEKQLEFSRDKNVVELTIEFVVDQMNQEERRKNKTQYNLKFEIVCQVESALKPIALKYFPIRWTVLNLKSKPVLNESGRTNIDGVVDIPVPAKGPAKLNEMTVQFNVNGFIKMMSLVKEEYLVEVPHQYCQKNSAKGK